jgi:hypothetical protein
MKNWAAHSKPPQNGRARLLWEAAQASKKKPIVSPAFLHNSIGEHPARTADVWSQTLFFSWVFEHSVQSGMPLRVC